MSDTRACETRPDRGRVPVVTDTAVALLRDGSRIPLSDPLDEARRHWRDGEYDSDVVGIEHSGEATDAQPVAQDNRTPEQLALI